MDEITISVIIPVYQVERYLREAVDSAIGACERFGKDKCEIILVDDGSTDNSGSICDQYETVSSMITVIHQRNGGLSAARNTGLSAAKGKYVYFLDSDDYIQLDTIANTIAIAEQENADVVFFDASVFYTDCDPEEKPPSYARYKRYQTGHGKKVLAKLLFFDEYKTAVPLMIFKKDYLQKNDLFFEPGLLHEDELFTGLVYLMDGTVSHCHEQLYARRIRPDSIMTATSAKRDFENYLKIFNTFAKLFENEKIYGNSAKKYTARSARTVYVKYQKLPLEIKKEFSIEFDQFKQCVIENKFYGDIGLKRNFESGIKKRVYEIEWKIFRRIKKKVKRAR